MNVNLLKKVSQNSKKCNKIIYNILFHEKSCASQSVRYNSTLSALCRKNLAGQIPLFLRAPRRCYSEDNGPPASSHKLPPLMDIPMVVWPSVFKSLKNLIITTFIIKPYLDAEFTLPDFVTGSKKAVEVVSHRLVKGQSLEGLVSSDIIPSLQDKISKMSLGQRDLITVNVGDIYFAFPYQIGIIFSEDSLAQKRFVEITMVYHVLQGLAQMRLQGEEPPLNVGLLPEYQDKLSVCNYRFIKEFTKGVESDWTVNLLNHFRPMDEAS